MRITIDGQPATLADMATHAATLDPKMRERVTEALQAIEAALPALTALAVASGKSVCVEVEQAAPDSCELHGHVVQDPDLAGLDPWYRLTAGLLSPEEAAALHQQDPERYELHRPVEVYDLIRSRLDRRPDEGALAPAGDRAPNDPGTPNTPTTGAPHGEQHRGRDVEGEAPPDPRAQAPRGPGTPPPSWCSFEKFEKFMREAPPEVKLIVGDPGDCLCGARPGKKPHVEGCPLGPEPVP